MRAQRNWSGWSARPTASLENDDECRALKSRFSAQSKERRRTEDEDEDEQTAALALHPLQDELPEITTLLQFFCPPMTTPISNERRSTASQTKYPVSERGRKSRSADFRVRSNVRTPTCTQFAARLCERSFLRTGKSALRPPSLTGYLDAEFLAVGWVNGLNE